MKHVILLLWLSDLGMWISDILWGGGGGGVFAF